MKCTTNSHSSEEEREETVDTLVMSLNKNIRPSQINHLTLQKSTESNGYKSVLNQMASFPFI